MKKIFLFILFTLTTTVVKSQIHEVGALFGMSNFIGDIGRTNYWLPNAFGGGVIYKYNINPRIALRVNYLETSLKGNDISSSNEFRNVRNSSFTNNINELAIGTEFNFFLYNTNDYYTAYTPYILTQVALINYSKADAYNRGTLITSEETGFAIPVGGGFKGRIIENFSFAIESGVRFTFKDNLDYTTNNIKELNFGKQGNDHYVFTAISLVYTFGRPPCFAEYGNQ